MYRELLLLILLVFHACNSGVSTQPDQVSQIAGRATESTVSDLSVGAEQLALYVPSLTGKSCALVVNQSSMVDDRHLVDTLRALDVNILKIFVPEHGFRGKADRGAHVEDEKDGDTGLNIISLYGKNKKPSAEALDDVDVVIFDLQDVGVRCYTYISTLHHVMEACAETNTKLIVLDRPNPNGHYVSGPVRKSNFESFIAMHPVPLIHGLTMGEYAQMIKGEKWIESSDQLNMEVIPCVNYTHDTRYVLSIPPSPNLRSEHSVLLYPSLVFFEGTVVSVGRGTDHPFEVFGHPDFEEMTYEFTPKSVEGASHPVLMDELCKGRNLSDIDPYIIRNDIQFSLAYLIEAYKAFPDKESFFLDNGFFDKLAGNTDLKEDIIAGKDISDIQQSWDAELNLFMAMRAPYLIYD